MYALLKEVFHNVVTYAILVLEAVGVIILLFYSIKALIALLTSSKRSKHLLSNGITTSLSFLLGGEVLKTIVAPDWKSIGMTCAILLMRAAVTLLLHWESQHEEE